MADEADSMLRTCKHCNVVKPLAEFRKDRQRRTWQCKKCRSEARKAAYREERGGLVRRPKAVDEAERKARKREAYLRYKARHPDRVKAQGRQSYERKKGDSDFKLQARERYLRWRENNTERERANQRRWREQNRQKALAYNDKYRRENPQYAADREKRAARQKAYREANPEHARAVAASWRSRRVEALRDYWRKYRKTEKGRIAKRRAEQRRRARKMGVMPVASGAEVTALLAAATHCHYCRAAFGEGLRPTLDHKIPLARKGEHALKNFAVACMPCNSRKGVKTAEEFFDFLRENESAQVC